MASRLLFKGARGFWYDHLLLGAHWGKGEVYSPVWADHLVSGKMVFHLPANTPITPKGERH